MSASKCNRVIFGLRTAIAQIENVIAESRDISYPNESMLRVALHNILLVLEVCVDERTKILGDVGTVGGGGGSNFKEVRGGASGGSGMHSYAVEITHGGIGGGGKDCKDEREK